MRKGWTSFGACEVRYLRWLFGNIIPISLLSFRIWFRRCKPYLAPSGDTTPRRMTCVKSLQSSCTGLYPQTPEQHSGVQEMVQEMKAVPCTRGNAQES